MLLTPALRRRFVAPLVAAAAAACLVLAAPAAASARAFIEQEHNLQVSDEVCGIPVEVTGHFTVVRNDNEKAPLIAVQRITFTAENGKSVTTSSAEADLDRIVDNGDGTATETFQVRGTPERISVPGAGNVLLDAGRIVITTTFDLATHEPIGPDEVTVAGPHPDFESNFAAECDAIVAALT